ncbi:MAG: DUF3267 domain-containing protein [Anaerolineae bacterium]
MFRNPVRELPPGWAETRRVVLTEDQLLLRLNLWSLVPLAISAIAMLIWAFIVSSTHATAPAGPDIPWWLAIILSLLVLPLHELVHAILILGVGHRPRMGMKLDKGVLYATADNALFTRNQYLAVALSPFIVISVAGAASLLVLPSGWWWTVALAVILNAGGAIGDLWVSAQVIQAPATALVRDTEDGFVLYMREVAD